MNGGAGRALGLGKKNSKVLVLTFPFLRERKEGKVAFWEGRLPALSLSLVNGAHGESMNESDGKRTKAMS